MFLSKAERTAAITRSIASGKRAPLASFDSRKYIQHNVNLGDGLLPILEFMDGLPPDRTRAEVIRLFEDGDHSVVHADYVLGDWGPMVGFEVHRWENDRIVEHWDNLCPTPENPNPSGRRMVDGETAVLDLDRTEENRRTVESFSKEVLLTGQLPPDSPFFEGNTFVQHSPFYGDGVDAFQAALASRWNAVTGVRYTRVHKILGQGNLFLVMSEGTSSGQAAAFYDLYRLQNGYIAEHWEVFEVTASSESWKNDNGKF